MRRRGHPRFRGRPTALRTGSISSAICSRPRWSAQSLFALYYVNWTYGWITPEDLDFYHANVSKADPNGVSIACASAA